MVLVDTNVIIDFLMTREPFYKASAEVITKCVGKELDGYIALHSVSNLWYILRKVPEDKRRKWLIDICQCLHVEGICHEDVIKAIKMAEFKDFEDCLQDRCAENIKAEYIITRNVKDFEGSTVQAVLPEKFLEITS